MLTHSHAQHPTPPATDSPPTRAAKPDAARRGAAWREIALVALGLIGFTGLVWQVRGELGMTWDEPYFFERQHDMRRWLAQVAGSPAERAEAFSTTGLERSWRVCREVPDQHPPVPPLLSLATGVAFEWLIGPLRAYRLSTVIVMAVTAGVLVRLVRLRWGAIPAIVALGALIFNPRIFADAQQITADSDLGAFWFLAAVAFLRSCETGRAVWAFGVLAGLAIMCKATGVLVLPAMLLWALLFRPSGWWRPIVWSIPIVPVTMTLINPAWWSAPVAGMLRWVRAFLAYPQKVPVYYLGQVYDSVRTFLPWHNTLVLTAVMVPLGILLLTTWGLIATGWTVVRSRRPADRSATADSPTRSPRPERLPDSTVAAWGAINFLTMMVMRVFHFMPAHDGLRQLVPAFYFVPILAAFGAWLLLRSSTGMLHRLVQVGVCACVLSSAWVTLAIHPYELAYYNALIGGPKGAKAAGMESTYFWDPATDEVLAWMNTHLPPRATVLIFPPPNIHTFDWEQRWGRLRRDLTILNLDAPDFNDRIALMFESKPCYLIFQMRQGLYKPRQPGESTLFDRLADAPALFELAPARVGVRLLAIFDQAQFRSAVDGSKAGASPTP